VQNALTNSFSSVYKTMTRGKRMQVQVKVKQSNMTCSVREILSLTNQDWTECCNNKILIGNICSHNRCLSSKSSICCQHPVPKYNPCICGPGTQNPSNRLFQSRDSSLAFHLVPQDLVSHACSTVWRISYAS
jgi:hypothetical protein